MLQMYSIFIRVCFWQQSNQFSTTDCVIFLHPVYLSRGLVSKVCLSINLQTNGLSMVGHVWWKITIAREELYSTPTTFFLQVSTHKRVQIFPLVIFHHTCQQSNGQVVHHVNQWMLRHLYQYMVHYLQRCTVHHQKTEYKQVELFWINLEHVTLLVKLWL